MNSGTEYPFSWFEIYFAGRVLVLHEKCEPNDDDPNEGWAKCHERFKACARFELVPQESNEWIALILIIVFCVLIIIIILAVIIYCCIKNKCCGKYTTVPVDPDEKLPGILTEQTMLLGLVCRHYFFRLFCYLVMPRSNGFTKSQYLSANIWILESLVRN